MLISWLIMDTPISTPTKKPRSAKAIFREPTPEDPRRRITRTKDEMREMIMTFRISRAEMNELYRYARARGATMSYMIREALVAAYPEIFGEANRYIRKPRRPKPVQEKTILQQSLVDGSIRVILPTEGTKSPTNRP